MSRVATVREPLSRYPADGLSLHVHPGWRESLPWLLQGTTGRGSVEPFDLGLAGSQPVASALARWWRLRDFAGASGIAFARQVHGADVIVHDCAPGGILLCPPADGHATLRPDLLLAVSVADCVPIFVAAETPRAVTLLHAGWRGIAAGILESGLAALARLGAGDPDALRVHFGPSICGDCYEVGPEVHAALGHAPPGPNAPIDLKTVLAQRAIAAGVAADRISRSAWCTRCDRDAFFSHRGGDAGRQVAILGIANRTP